MIEKFKTDVGFYLITMVLAKIVKNYNVYLILTSLIYLIPVAVFIYKKSTNPLYSYFLFFCFGLFTFSMSTLRQTIAIGLCIIAYLLKDKPIKKLLALVLAISIHMSALVFLPVLFIHKIKINTLTKTVAIVLPLATVVFMSTIQAFILSFSSKNIYGTTKVGGYGMILFLAVVVVLGWYILIRKPASSPMHSNNIEILIFVYLALLVFVATRFNLAVMRLYYYYFIYIIVLIPNLVSSISNKERNTGRIISTMFVCVSIYFLIFNTFNDPYSVGSKLLPYSFFWE
jgi:hypothetical protein